MFLKETAISLMNALGKSKTPFLFIIDFEMNNNIVRPLTELDHNEIRFNLNGYKNYDTTNVVVNKPVSLTKKPVSHSRYITAFNEALYNINSGNSYLLNLTFPSEIEINHTLEEIFFLSSAKYKLYLDDQFVVFSPETFVNIRNGLIASFPMKGTINQKIKNAENHILNDVKEIAEHATIVDLIRNDLSMVANEVKVEQYRYIDKVETHEGSLLQVSSKITGNLEKDYHEKIGDIIFRLLPAGSVTGAPKKKTVEIIKKIENYERGFYTGIFGVFDGQNLDSGVIIRYIENIRGKLVFKSGGGITSLSNLESEYQELIDKVYVPIDRKS
jgi:para-aminobenzoate synthetase component I